MLRLFREKKGALKWTLWLVIGGLSVGMVGLFVYTPGDLGGGLGGQHVARVAGTPIAVSAYQLEYSRLANVYQQIASSIQQNQIFQPENLSQQALDRLIAQYAMQHEASRLGIRVTDQEIAERIRLNPVFMENGEFIGAERYQQILAANNFTVASFEEGLRRQIVEEKLTSVLTDSIVPTEREIRDEFERRNREVKIRYVAIDISNLEVAESTEEELAAYYEENKRNYELPERRRLRYVRVSVSPEDVELDEEAVASRMGAFPEVESVRASHILLRVGNEEEADKIREKAEGLVRELREGADFATLAGRHSEDTTNAARGGDLGHFGRGTMVRPFENVAFSTPEGEISDPVRTQFGYHIIKVTEVRKTDRRAAAENAFLEDEVRRQASNRAAKMLFRLRKGAGIEELAEEHGLEIETTGFFSAGDNIPGLQVPKDFNQKMFALSVGQWIDQPYEAGRDVVIAQVSEIEPAADQPLEAVRNRVVRSFLEQKRDEAGREKAFAFAEAARAGDFLQTARSQKLDVHTTGFFTRNDSIDDTLRRAPTIVNQAFSMAEGAVSGAQKVGLRYVVFQLTERKPLEEERFAEERKSIWESLVKTKRQRFFDAWIQNVLDRLYDANEILVNQELVDALNS